MVLNSLGPFTALTETEEPRDPFGGKGCKTIPGAAALEDEDLIALVAGGDATAFSLLYDRHSRAAYSVAYEIAGERHTVEDILQNAFLRVWWSAGTYRADRGIVKTWILAIVQNQAIDELRTRAARHRKLERLKATAPRPQPSEGFVERRDPRRKQLREALDVLPPEQLEVVRLVYFSGHTHPEIAELLELPLGTVKGRMRLALRKLRAHFGAQDGVVQGPVDLSAGVLRG